MKKQDKGYRKGKQPSVTKANFASTIRNEWARRTKGLSPEAKRELLQKEAEALRHQAWPDAGERYEQQQDWWWRQKLKETGRDYTNDQYSNGQYSSDHSHPEDSSEEPSRTEEA